VTKRSGRWLLIVAFLGVIGGFIYLYRYDGTVATTYAHGAPRDKGGAGREVAPTNKDLAAAGGTLPGRPQAKTPAPTKTAIDRSQPFVKSSPNATALKMLGSVKQIVGVYQTVMATPAESRTADDWHALHDVMMRCRVTADSERSGWGTPEEKLKKLVSDESSPRFTALQTMRTMCAGVPPVTDEAMSEVATRLHALNHAWARVAPLRGLAENGYAHNAHDDLLLGLSDPNPLLANQIASMVSYEINLTGSQAEFAGRGINAADIEDAWRLAACDLAGGCGKDSHDVLVLCFYTAKCDATSLLDYSRKYEPERFASLDALRQRILDSYRTGDWAWLDLPTLRSRLPGKQ
jgi:hypothetical protein